MKKVIGVCGVAIAFGALFACIATKQSYLSKGNKLYDEGKYADAALNYRKAIQKDPGFGEAYYHFGLAAIKQEQAREAYTALFRAYQLLPGRVDVAEKFADVCLSFYLADSSHPQLLYKQITQLSDELLAKNANSYEGLMLKGYLSEVDRQPKDAIAFFTKALKVNNSDGGVSTATVQLLLQDGQTQEAERLANDMMHRQKTSYGQIYDLMYSYYYNANRVPDAENVLKTKVSNNPKHAGYILQLARHYARVRNPVEMQATLRLLLENHKDFPEARVWVGNFYSGIQEYDEAVRNYDAGARGTPNRKERIGYQEKIMLARLAQGKTAEASQLAESILKQDPENENALRLRADALLSSNKTDKMIDGFHIFEKLSARHPDDPVLRYHLGLAFKVTGDLSSARTQFLESIKRRRDFLRPRYDLVEVYLFQQNPAEALKQANEILALKPNDPRGMLLHARSLVASGNLGQARAELNTLIKASPQDSEPQLQLGLLALRENKAGSFQEATDIFQKLRLKGERNAFLALATTYSSERRPDQAISVLMDGLRRWPDSVQILAQLASTEALAGRYDLAIIHVQKLLEEEPKSVLYHLRMAQINDIKGDLKKATEYYQQAHDLAPSDPAIAMTLADAFARGGRTAEARRIYQGVVKAHPDNTTALNNLAFLMADTDGDLTEALRLAKQALDKSAEPNFSDTIGFIYLKQGQRESAFQTFNTLVHKNPKNPIFHYHLGMALIAKGDKAAARKELQAALDAHPAPREESRIKELLGKT